jgi:acylglycerol lipase
MPAISQHKAVSTERINTVLCEDGYRLRYRVWRGLNPSGTVVLVNGMMSHSGWFRELAQGLTVLHLDVVGADRRGSGLNEAGRGGVPSRQMLVSDFCRIIESEDGSVPFYLVGWCWGALPAVNVALELGDKLSGLVLLAPGMFPSPPIRRIVQEELAASQGTDPDYPALRSPLTAEMFSNREDIREFIRNDELAQRLFTPRLFRITGEMSLIAAARLSQLKQRLLLLLAADDETADNEQTLKAVQRLPKAAVTIATLRCHHGMQFEMPQEIVKHISQWLQQRGL